MHILKNTNSLQSRAFSLGEKAVPFFIIAIHFSTAATLVLSIFIALLWLASGQIKYTILIARQAPMILFALLLLAYMLFSISYSLAPYPEAFATLSKYRKLLLLLVLIPFLNTDHQRKRCENFLLAALITSLIIAFAGFFDLLPSDLSELLLKNHITHSLFMAFLGFFCIHQLYGNKSYRLLWASVLILVVVNLFIVADGRTGQLAFLLLSALFFLQVFSFRTALIFGVTTIAAFTLFLLFSPYAERLHEGIDQSISFYHNDPSVGDTSMGLRLTWWNSTLTIIQQSPWLGDGIGGLPYKFHEIFPNLSQMVNPHNEYLLITAQLGLLGLFMFLAFLASILRHATHLAQTQRWLLQGIWLSFVASCFFNSSLLDHTEGHWFITLIALYSAPLITSKACLASSSSPKMNPNI
ncbi:hypothetical protein A1359_00720 [Methylomonas lenta]|uniref:O-antigen ligase-related domain-containing protein n=1 Tax=Methylomonas lenta TaxID=980561 RepID=A0A177NBL0_9GAMM|nr:hypothetical protein A1359_00720 [Methylomonas lenta]